MQSEPHFSCLPVYGVSAELCTGVCPPGAESEGAKRICLWVAEGTSMNGGLDNLQIFLGDKAEEILARSNGFSNLVLALWPDISSAETHPNQAS